MRNNRYFSPLLVMVAIAAITASCGLYKKYETPADVPLIDKYAQALQAPVDSSELGNLRWQEVFTDPLLRSYIA